MGPFTQDNENKMFIPDPATKKGKGRSQTRRIRNGMDESEASKTQINMSGNSSTQVIMSGKRKPKTNDLHKKSMSSP